MGALAQELISQFYRWELRGRGWKTFPKSVEQEPPYYPFFLNLPSNKFVDDGKRSTLISHAIDLLFSKKKEIVQEDFHEPDPFDFVDDSLIIHFRLALPKGYVVKVDEMEKLLLMLSYTEAPVSFEIVGSHSAIVIQLTCREKDHRHIKSQIKAYFPTLSIEENRDILESDQDEEEMLLSIGELGLKDEFMCPLSSVKSFEYDPYIGLFGIIDHLESGELGGIQILFKGAVNSWAESIIQSVTDGDGKSIFYDAPEIVSFTKEKIASPMFAVNIRVFGQSYTAPNAMSITNDIGKAFIHLTRSSANSLIALSGNSFETMAADLMLRESHRYGMLLNSRELATMLHFPSASVTSSKLVRDVKRTKLAPVITDGHSFHLGINRHQGIEKKVTISDNVRLKHMHVIGATGTGKSTLLLQSILEDIKNGNGIGVLDPHGDLIEAIIARIPANRMTDVIVIDPADTDYPLGFNILQAHSEIEKDILSSDLVAAFKRLSTSWGDQMNSILANTILAFLESSVGGTLLDVRRFLIEKNFRDTFLKSVSDPNIIYYWQKEFPLIKSNSIGPILTRLDTFLRPKLIRNMVAQKKSLDFEKVLNTNKILLVKLSQGLIGMENSYLLGTFIVSKIHQAALSRQSLQQGARSNFYFYIDEFQHFITPSMASILSGARKYHVGLILAHQDMQQLSKQDSELASAVLSNAGTRVCFRVGDQDAKRFEEGFSFFESKDLQNLETGEAIVRVERPEFDFNLSITPLPDLEIETKETISNYVIAKSREKYGTPKMEVEELQLKSQGEYFTEDARKSFLQKEIPIERVDFPLSKQKEEYKEPVQKIKTQVNDAKAEEKSQTEHRYLQFLIKRMAESRGYKAVLEEPTPDGKGRVDVGLFRNDKRIACEISVTTKEVWEAHNVEKCFAAGYEIVIVCSTDQRNLERIHKLAKEKLAATTFSKLFLLQPEALFLYLDQQVAQESNKEEKIKGYRVKVEYNAVAPDVAHQKKDSILKTVTESLRKKGK